MLSMRECGARAALTRGSGRKVAAQVPSKFTSCRLVWVIWRKLVPHSTTKTDGDARPPSHALGLFRLAGQPVPAHLFPLRAAWRRNWDSFQGDLSMGNGKPILHLELIKGGKRKSASELVVVTDAKLTEVSRLFCRGKRGDAVLLNLTGAYSTGISRAE